MDDEPLLLRALVRSLEASYTVRSAQSASEAIKSLERDPGVDVVVSDLKMPGMDGVHLLAEVHRRWPGCRLVLLSAHIDVETAQWLVNELGVVQLLSKPCTPTDIRRGVGRALERQPSSTGGTELPRWGGRVERLRAAQLLEGMVLEEPARSTTGALLAPKGASLIEPIIIRLQQLAARGRLIEPLSVRTNAPKR